MTDHRDGWLTIRQAALQLGVSELTIRRRIKDGRYPHRLDSGKYLVRVGHPEVAVSARVEPGPQGDHPDQEAKVRTHAVSARPKHATDQGVIRVDTLLRDYSRAVERAGQASLLERQVQELQAQNANLQESLLTLAGRNGWLESRLDERENELKLLADEQHKPPWWKRLWG